MIINLVPRGRVVRGIRYDGDNISEIWDAFGAGLIYGPTEHTREITVTGPGGKKAGMPGDWVIEEPTGELDLVDADHLDLLYTESGRLAANYRPTFVLVPRGTTAEELEAIVREEVATGEHPHGFLLIPDEFRGPAVWRDLSMDGTVVGAVAHAIQRTRRAPWWRFWGIR